MGRTEIAALGVELGPAVLEASQELYGPLQTRLASEAPATVTVDLEYGPHPRQRLDLYLPGRSGERRDAPVLLWVHGGGFIRGEKSSPDHPFNAHVGRWAARNGLLGAVMNYRLAPEFGWPSGGEDVGRAIDWLKRNSAAHGGDPDRIVVAGTSAGAAHIGTYLQLRPGVRDVRGVVLLSGVYGASPMSGPDSNYFGSDESVYAQRASLESVAKSAVPLFVAGAEFDPQRFQVEMVALLQAVLRARGTLPRTHFASGHNHYTLAMHLGTDDTRLSDEILAFAHDCCNGG